MRHNPEACEVCKVIEENPEKTNTQLGYLADTSERSIRRHKGPNPSDTQPLASVPEPFYQDVPTEIITSRGRSIRTPDGWEKITYRPQDMAMHEALKYDDIAKAIEGFDPRTVPTVKPVGNTRTAVLCLSDWQIGKTGLNGGTEETVARILRSTEAFCRDVQACPPAEVLLMDLGDVLEGFSNVGSQAQTNDLDLTSQVRTARRLMVEVLKQVSKATGGQVPVKLVSVPSNHCQVRTKGKDLASTPNNDWGVELNHQLEDVFSDRPEWTHVSFLRPANEYAEVVTTTTRCGVVVGAVHGHQAANPNNVADFWKGQSHGRRNNLHNADILAHGHFHTASLCQTGDERWVIGTASSDPGSDWYTNKTGNTSTAGMTAFDIVLGKTPWCNLRLL